MKEELITFETAKLAKEKGFDVPCNTYYDNEYLKDKPLEIDSKSTNWNKAKSCVSAPTQSLLQKWLRDTYEIFVSPIKRRGLGFDISIRKISREGDYESQFVKGSHLWSYEEALEIGLMEALKLINN